MKVIDRAEGKIFGVNFVDLFVLLFVGYIVFSFAGQILSKDLVFGGEEMYNAIQSYQRLSSKGFLIEADVKGKWIADNSEFSEKGILLSTRGGSFVLKTRDGKLVTIGGSMAYLEDIAASEIVLEPLDNHVLIMFSEPMEFPSYSELLAHLKERREEFKSDHLLLTADIAFMKPAKASKDIHNELEELYLVTATPMLQGGAEEAIFRVNLAELSELEKLDIASESITLGKATLVFGYNEFPGKLPIGGEYHIASIQELL